MSDPRDARGRNVHPFNAPEDYADPWRGRRMPILLTVVGLLALLVLVYILA